MDEVIIEKLEQNKEGNYFWNSITIKLDTENDFSINESNLDFEICRAGKLLLKYGDLAAELRAMYERKKEELDYLKARTAAAYRAQFEKDKVKFSEAKIAESVLTNENVQLSTAALNHAKVDQLKAEHWHRNIQKKADLLQSLAYKLSAEIRRTP